MASGEGLSSAGAWRLDERAGAGEAGRPLTCFTSPEPPRNALQQVYEAQSHFHGSCRPCTASRRRSSGFSQPNKLPCLSALPSTAIDSTIPSDTCDRGEEEDRAVQTRRPRPRSSSARSTTMAEPGPSTQPATAEAKEEVKDAPPITASSFQVDKSLIPRCVP